MYDVKCDECKCTIRTTEDVRESYAGGKCGTCSRRLPHADRIEKMLREGKKQEAMALHNAHVERTLERAKSEPTNLSDLIAGHEAFILDDIKRKE